LPNNEIEQHPYLNYLQVNEKDIRQNNIYKNIIEFKNIIIGTFPVYGCTDTIDSIGNIIESRNTENMRFFYGSKRSDFWLLFSQVFLTNIPSTPIEAITALNNNNFLISDVIRKTKRKGKSASDKDLLPVELNTDLIKFFKCHENLKNIYFTSTEENGNSPYSLFKTIFNISNEQEFNRFEIDSRLWSLNLIIDEREFNVFFLPTPKTRGIHFNDHNKLRMFVNYLNSVDNSFYQGICNIRKNQRTNLQEDKLTIYRKDFLLECYKQSLKECNLKFNGSINCAVK